MKALLKDGVLFDLLVYRAIYSLYSLLSCRSFFFFIVFLLCGEFLLSSGILDLHFVCPVLFLLTSDQGCHFWLTFFFFNSSIFYLSMVDLQCCTNFCCTGKWLSYAHTDILFWFTADYCQLWIGMFHSGLVSCWKLVCRRICRSPSLGSITSRPFLTNTLPGNDRQFDQLASRSHTYMWDFWETS